jgi:hypothetical protein
MRRSFLKFYAREEGEKDYAIYDKTMKKMTNWVLAATLVIICGASVLTSCSNDNAPAGGRRYSKIRFCALHW